MIYPCYLAVNIPPRFSQVLYSIIFKSCPPNIFDGIAKAEIHMFRDLDALDSRGMVLVM
jgi:hypothetical protein